MKEDEIIEMARQAGMELYGLGKNRARFVHHLEAFAKLVAIHVSRELAKECAGMGEWNAVHIIEGVRW